MISNIEIKLTHEQHDTLFSHLGSEEAIHDWLEGYIDQELRRIVAEKKK